MVCNQSFSCFVKLMFRYIYLLVFLHIAVSYCCFDILTSDYYIGKKESLVPLHFVRITSQLLMLCCFLLLFLLFIVIDSFSNLRFNLDTYYYLLETGYLFLDSRY